MQTYFEILSLVFGYGIGIPVLLGALVASVSHQNKFLSVQVAGFWAQIIFGGLGIIIHELSHLVVALLVGHHIKEVALIRIPNRRDPTDQSLGYVSHTWNQASLYQRAGNVFIGIAPVLICPLVMLGLTRLLVPGVYTFLFNQSIDQVNHGWATIVWLLVMVSIAIGGFDLSQADLENSQTGLVSLLIVILVASGILTLITDPTSLKTSLYTLMAPLDGALLFALVVNGLVYVALLFLRHLLHR